VSVELVELQGLAVLRVVMAEPVEIVLSEPKLLVMVEVVVEGAEFPQSLLEVEVGAGLVELELLEQQPVELAEFQLLQQQASLVKVSLEQLLLLRHQMQNTVGLVEPELTLPQPLHH